ncbi:MAG: hypothetical protein RMA76_13645 [Deltaproteobacteria bacterium]|jgi:hypothetical protein
MRNALLAGLFAFVTACGGDEAPGLLVNGLACPTGDAAETLTLDVDAPPATGVRVLLENRTAERLQVLRLTSTIECATARFRGAEAATYCPATPRDLPARGAALGPGEQAEATVELLSEADLQALRDALGDLPITLPLRFRITAEAIAPTGELVASDERMKDIDVCAGCGACR